MEKEPVADVFRPADEALHVALQLLDRSCLPHGRIERRPPIHRQGRGRRRCGFDTQPLGELVQSFSGPRAGRAAPFSLDQPNTAPRCERARNPRQLALDAFQRRRLERSLLVHNRGELAVLDNEPARQNQRGNLGVAEFVQQSPDIAIDRLRPDGLAAVEVSAHQRRVDPLVERGGIKGDQAPLPVAGHADPPASRVFSTRPQPGTFARSDHVPPAWNACR